jgi:arsenical resistance protein ArsH
MISITRAIATRRQQRLPVAPSCQTRRIALLFNIYPFKTSSSSTTTAIRFLTGITVLVQQHHSKLVSTFVHAGCIHNANLDCYGSVTTTKPHNHQQRLIHSKSSDTSTGSSDPNAILRHTTSATTTMTEATVPFDMSLWNGNDKEQFDSLHHPGYALHYDATTYLGGWLAHRIALETNHSNNGDNSESNEDWIQTDVAPYITKFDYTSMPIGRAPKILVLYGSLRTASFSRKMAYEFARLLELVGCTVRVYNPMGLPVRNPDDTGEQHVKVVELRALTHWSDGHVWVSPEMHGTITGTFKNQIDWIPLNTGSVRPTQGKTCCVAQVNGGSQSFNAVNALRLLARWMRMPCCTNQSSVAKAWQEFLNDEQGGRMKPSGFRNRVVDVVEEFAKFTAVMVPVADQLTDRYSERMEILHKGRLLTQAEKETQKVIDQSRSA